MSFVDLMANDVWSNADINAKVQALIRYRYSENDELKAARLARIGENPEFVEAVDQWIEYCVAEGKAARADMALLQQAFYVEDAERRLTQPVVEPEYDEYGNIINQEAVDQDEAERLAAQLVIDDASPEVMALVEQRGAVPEYTTGDTDD